MTTTERKILDWVIFFNQIQLFWYLFTVAIFQLLYAFFLPFNYFVEMQIINTYLLIYFRVQLHMKFLDDLLGF